jgi:transglutaminase-like putative cysteine protease
MSSVAGIMSDGGIPDEAALKVFLSPADYIDSDHPRIREAAARIAGDASDHVDAVQRLYRAVRDDIRYDPYVDYTVPDTYRASSVFALGRGYCVGKAAVFAALCRASGIAARIGLADVKNHLATPRLLETVRTDVFSYHGYVEIFPARHWIKATPTFNIGLCRKLGVPPLEFDGRTEALLQPFDAAGREFMVYLRNYGTFFDVPAKFLMAEMARIYPQLCVSGGLRGPTMEDESRGRMPTD